MSADLVVVGAGSAGAVIASRASERPDQSVLLLEAGPDYPDGRVPAPLSDGTRNALRGHDWGYRHRPAAGQFLFPFPRGRVVGGSSAVNTCIALRGQPYDYDEWGQGDWTWAKCLPAFKRLEDDLDFDNQWHGRGGPIPIRRHPRHELARWQAAFLDACAGAGYPACPDSNDPTLTGAGPHAMNKVGGQRMSAARGYLGAAVRLRPNLAIRPETVVHRVVVRAGRVTGLLVETAGRREHIPAQRVVLSAGAIATPGILLRSGIGPRRAVERVGATPLVENPAIGARLLDHPGTAFFLLPRRGVCRTSDPIIQTLLRISVERPNDVILQPGSWVHLPIAAVPLISIMVAIGKPHGHGTITFTSGDPKAPPIIESSLLHHPVDRRTAIDALRLGADLVARSEMSRMGRVVWPPPRALASVTAMDSWVRKLCDSGYHPSGTVPMGSAVDARGRVPGVDGLFVADASIMPTVPSSNINLPTLMIGERFGAWFRDREL